MPLRVMVIDDSPVVRRAIGDAFRDVPGVEVFASAPNGRIALAKIDATLPDVCIVDLEMPDMDGITLIGHLAQRHPRPRVLVLTANGSLAASRAVQALMHGAADVVMKPVVAGGYDATLVALREALLPKLLQFAAAGAIAAPPVPPPRPAGASWRPKALLVGVSTGGPEALARLVPALPPDFPLPVLLVQHMPPGFTRTLAERLDRLSPLAVREAAGDEPVRPGTVWIAPGGRHLELVKRADGVFTRLSDEAPENLCRPAVDVLFRAAAAVWGGDVLAAVMTGMGDDGAQGARMLKRCGARVVVQDQASSVVWGMPGAVVAAEAADEVLALDALGPRLGALAWGAVA